MGIHSYRTRQVVDFERLGADGLFGIFGPTGSGKSSILDAITLALYGGVDRAANNTRGIIHQLEKSLEVSFQFELGECHYLVERRYDRNPKDPEAVVAKQARLRQFAAGAEQVLASKPQEVTAQVEAILGIRREEFSRAVVLPQGKFDQFLRLTGGERATMLEHLFNLEQFGEALLGKVKHEAARCNEQLQRLEGEIQGLGECSPEALTHAVMALTSTAAQYEECQKAWEELDQAYQAALNLRELVVKRESIMVKRAQLAGQDAAMLESQVRLEAAERAEPLREMILRQQALTEKIATEGSAHQANAAQYQEALNRHAQAQLQWERLVQQADLEIPKLQTSKLQYQEGLVKQEKLRELQQDITQKQDELQEIDMAIRRLETALTSGETELKQLQAALTTLQTNRLQWVTSPEEKERIQRGLEVAVRLEAREDGVKKQEQRYTLWKGQNEARWTAIMGKVHDLWPEEILTAEEDIEQWAGVLVAQAEQELEMTRTAHHQAALMHSAAELVKTLRAGEPCPVCGSREHPHPVQDLTQASPLEEAIRTAEKRLKTVRQWEGDLLKLWREWLTNEPLVREARSELEAGQKELWALVIELEQISGGLDREGLRRRWQQLTEFDQRLAEQERERDVLLKKQEDWAAKVHQYNEVLQKGNLKAAMVQEALKHGQTQYQELSTQFQGLTGGQDLKRLLDQIEEALGRIGREVASAKEEEAAARTVLDGLAREKAGLEATLQANRNDLAEIERRLVNGMAETGFQGVEAAQAALLPPADRQTIRKALEDYRQAGAVIREEWDRLEQEIDGRLFDAAQFDRLEQERQTRFEEIEQLKVRVTLARNHAEQLREKQGRWETLHRQREGLDKRKNLADLLTNLLRGRRFVSFLAQEHLQDMVLEASYQLGRLTGQRYALELSKDKDCEFVIRDDYHGGQRRTVNSLSGGEVFLTSLALALALSAKIQLRGKYPLGFFFLDEGFGSLDEEKLDKVINALEKLHDHRRMVGVISHVRELRERLSRYVEVVPGEGDGTGSRIK